MNHFFLTVTFCYARKTLRVGAVGNVKTVKNVISLARAVIRHTTSTFLAGEDGKFKIRPLSVFN